MSYNHTQGAERIRALMAKQGFDMRNLSLAANLGETTVRDLLIRSDKGNPRIQTLFSIARALKTDPGYIMGLTDEPSHYHVESVSGSNARLPKSAPAGATLHEKTKSLPRTPKKRS